jgi:hypothetical protein
LGSVEAATLSRAFVKLWQRLYVQIMTLIFVILV